MGYDSNLAGGVRRGALARSLALGVLVLYVLQHEIFQVMLSQVLSFGHQHASLSLRRFRRTSGSRLIHIKPNLEQLLSGNSYRWLYNEDVREHAVSPSKK